MDRCDRDEGRAEEEWLQRGCITLGNKHLYRCIHSVNTVLFEMSIFSAL
jgi:hypothetical protein